MRKPNNRQKTRILKSRSAEKCKRGDPLDFLTSILLQNIKTKKPHNAEKKPSDKHQDSQRASLVLVYFRGSGRRFCFFLLWEGSEVSSVLNLRSSSCLGRLMVRTNSVQKWTIRCEFCGLTNKTRTSKVGAISQAQKATNIFFFRIFYHGAVRNLYTNAKLLKQAKYTELKQIYCKYLNKTELDTPILVKMSATCRSVGTPSLLFEKIRPHVGLRYRRNNKQEYVCMNSF